MMTNEENEEKREGVITTFTFNIRLEKVTEINKREYKIT